MSGAANGPWHKTACILCSLNCGLEVQTNGRHVVKLRGDRAHPASRGYTCEKPARGLDAYQNARDRVTTPLRRRADGSFEAVSWDVAIAGVAHDLGKVRDTHGGASILYYGGGGQGNHLPGGYGRATRAALGSVYASNALAQEKTGEFWVDAKLFGRPNCHSTPDFEHAEVAVFVGKNPWQSHGFPRARIALKEIARDSKRTLVVIDPRRTETAELADFHLQVKPGNDAFLLAALLAILVSEDAIDRAFLAAHTIDAEPVLAALAEVPIADYCARSGVPESVVREVAQRIGHAASVSILEDLGVQMAPHSTLNSYLEKLAWLLTGNFAKPGAMNLHTHFGALIGKSSERRTAVTGARVIGGVMPCNTIPDEILTDHPQRFRALLVESGNPAHSLADSRRMREAIAALECVVVIDVALTETAKLAHWVLPAATATREVGGDVLQLRIPAQRVPSARAGIRARAGHARGGRDPSPTGARARLLWGCGRDGAARRCEAGACAIRGRAVRCAREEPEAGAGRTGRAVRDARARAAGRRGERSGTRGARDPMRAGIPGFGAARRLQRPERDRARARALRRDPARTQRRRVQRRRAR